MQSLLLIMAWRQARDITINSREQFYHLHEQVQWGSSHLGPGSSSLKRSCQNSILGFRCLCYNAHKSFISKVIGLKLGRQILMTCHCDPASWENLPNHEKLRTAGFSWNLPGATLGSSDLHIKLRAYQPRNNCLGLGINCQAGRRWSVADKG